MLYNVVVSVLDFRSEGWWFEARSLPAIAVFVLVLEVLESPGILFRDFPGLENECRSWKVCSIIFGFLFHKGLFLQLLCIWETWKNLSEYWKVLEKSWKIVSEKGYGPCLMLFP